MTTMDPLLRPGNHVEAVMRTSSLEIVLLTIFEKYDSTTCCKRCRRNFDDTPNPYKTICDDGDCLPRRRPGGQECSPCVNFSGQDASPLKDCGAKEAVEKLQDKGVYNNYMVGLLNYERSRHKNNGKQSFCGGKRDPQLLLYNFECRLIPFSVFVCCAPHRCSKDMSL